MATHRLTPDQYHLLWDERHPPVLRIQSGDVVELETAEVTNGQYYPGAGAEQMAALDLDKCYPLVGPIYVEGAQKGDVLAVEMLELEALGWGWMAILSGLGLLSEEFKDPYLRTFDLSNGKYVPYRDDIRVPLEPFFGTMGVCPAGAKGLGVMPPGNFGGNMDVRHMKAGSTVYFPVQVEGALFSCGDGHAVQGDGEVCVTAMECPMRGTLRFTLIKDRQMNAPQFLTGGPLTPKVDGGQYYGTCGVSGDLMEGAKLAVGDMVGYIAQTYDMTRLEAYMLCSLCVDLKIGEIVDGGVYVVNALLPLSVFG